MDQVGLARPAPRLPQRKPLHRTMQAVAALGIHVFAIVLVVFLVDHASRRPSSFIPITQSPNHAITRSARLVFISHALTLTPSGGGGGGGNRQRGPIQRAQATGRDQLTLRIARPQLIEPRDGEDRRLLPGVLLDARPLASGTRDLLGLPDAGEPLSGSLGSGSGGGVGEGAGTGIGSGIGPGLGAGAGGGSGGGVYRPGGTVTPPRVITQVKPKYTDDALARKIQGTVTLDVVVKSDGRPGQMSVSHSIDPGGLDEAALAAAREWRFEPGRLSGEPVDVLVRLMLDFHIQ